MRDNGPVSTIAVVDSGRALSRRITASAHKVAEEMGIQVPVIKIHGENDMNRMESILATLEANGINTIPPPPIKQAKRKPPAEVQQQLMTDAEAKRERKRLKQLRLTKEF